MKLIIPLLLLTAALAHGDDSTNRIYVLTNREVKCIAFKPDYRFYEGAGDHLGLPIEAFVHLVAVRDGITKMLTTPTNLVNFVAINTKTQALEFVRLFSQEKTHYLFSGDGFLELPKYSQQSAFSFWYNPESVQRARAAKVPIDDPPIVVTRTNGVYWVSRYGIDWHKNILKVVELVSTNGTYSIFERRIVATNILTRMPFYL